MISKTKARRTLKNTKMPDEQIDDLLNKMYTMAEAFFEEIDSRGGSKKHSWVIDLTTKNNGH